MWKGIIMNNHYYVQQLTEQVFVVRKCVSANGVPGPDDCIARSFNAQHDASLYASTMNERQSTRENTVTTTGRDALSEKGKLQ
jgi:hypothetical protein